MKKHLKALEYMLIIVLFLYGVVYIILHGTGNYMDDGIELGFYFARISLGHGFALIAISYIALRLKRKWIPLLLTITNSVVACMLIGASIFGLETTILVDNFSNKYLVANTLINLRGTKKDAESAMFNDMNTVTRCNIAEVLCVIIQVAIVIVVLYSIFIFIMMFTKYAKKKTEIKKEYEKSIYISLLRIINILLGVIFVGIMIYIVIDVYGTHGIHSNVEAFYDTLVDAYFSYLLPAILLFIIADEWIRKKEQIKLLIFYVIYSFWGYFGIVYFIPGEKYVILARIYAILVGIMSMVVLIKSIYSFLKRKDLDYEKTL